jgi:ABC-type glutathione transport system ATPase component
MKRRLNFACGVVHKPKILLLDEPSTMPLQAIVMHGWRPRSST